MTSYYAGNIVKEKDSSIMGISYCSRYFLRLRASAVHPLSSYTTDFFHNRNIDNLEDSF